MRVASEMSTTEDKSEDKKEIEDEEREKMLNEENKKGDDKQHQETMEEKIQAVKKVGEGEVEKMKKALEESEKEQGKKKIPIGGIKIPGFLRSKSREKSKHTNSTVLGELKPPQSPSNNPTFCSDNMNTSGGASGSCVTAGGHAETGLV
uniref:Uncharacterized protein n=1 Tax=Timema douglasi TaxID=61478 RepID=A0A7R8VGU6_TIMDO|nr:unnamed protein product [Timema douglasi]